MYTHIHMCICSVTTAHRPLDTFMGFILCFAVHSTFLFRMLHNAASHFISLHFSNLFTFLCFL